jgi:hypothetical protein
MAMESLLTKLGDAVSKALYGFTTRSGPDGITIEGLEGDDVIPLGCRRT